jgi:hypothetical protein
VPSNLEKLRTTLLVQEKEVDKILKPIKSSWLLSIVNIVFDGWTNIARHPLINFIVSCLNTSVFFKAMNTLGKYKGAQYMGKLFMKVIEDVVVDSCANYYR